MTRYLLIESRTTWDDPAVGEFLALADGLQSDGNAVDLFLVQNAVLMARKGAAGVERYLGKAQLTLWVDEFALVARRLDRPALAAEIQVAGMDKLVQLLAAPDCKAIWH